MFRPVILLSFAIFVLLVACTPGDGREISAEMLTPLPTVIASNDSAETVPVNPQRPTATPVGQVVIDEEPLPPTPVGDFPNLPTAEPVSDVTLTWRPNPNIAEPSFYQALSDELDSQQANFDLVYQPETDMAVYVDKLTAEIVAGIGPDVFWLPGDKLAELVEWNALLDLGPYAAGYDMAAFYPGPLHYLSYDPASGEPGTRLWGLPSELDTLGIYLNLDLLAAAGAPDPRQLAAEGQWNWTALLAVAAAINDPANGIYGYEQPWNWQSFGVWANGAGGSLILPDGTCGLTTAESVAGFTFAHQLFQEAQVTSPYETSGSAFMRGEAGMGLFSHSLARYMQGLPFQWEVVELPAGPVSSGNWLFWGAYAVNAHTEHPTEAWQLVQALVAAETQAKLVAGGRIIPSRVELVDSFARANGSSGQAFLNGLHGATAIAPRWTGGLSYDDFSCSAATHLLSGRITLEEFAANACNQFTQASITVCP